MRVGYFWRCSAGLLAALLMVMQSIGIRDGYGGRKPGIGVLVPMLAIAVAMWNADEQGQPS